MMINLAAIFKESNHCVWAFQEFHKATKAIEPHTEKRM